MKQNDLNRERRKTISDILDEEAVDSISQADLLKERRLMEKKLMDRKG